MLHELLSNPSWIDPQINYLLWLQDLRIQTGGIFDKFFLSLTTAGELFWPAFVMSVIYWSVDTKAGLYLFMLNSLTNLANVFLKNIACIYRPWVLSNAIHPQEQAIRMAGGYSFPSGHSSMAVSSWGGIAYLTRKNIFICLIFALFVLLIGFSRNFLGVHTPQDVVIGILTGVIFIFALPPLIDWCEKDKNRYLKILSVIDILGIALLFFIILKNYPIDYLNGKLLVNPIGAKYISVVYIGWALGFLNGAVLCRKFFPFEAKDACMQVRIARSAAGALFFIFLNYITQNFIIGHNVHYRYVLPYTFFVGFFVTAIYPFCFNKIMRA